MISSGGGVSITRGRPREVQPQGTGARLRRHLEPKLKPSTAHTLLGMNGGRPGFHEAVPKDLIKNWPNTHGLN